MGLVLNIPWLQVGRRLLLRLVALAEMIDDFLRKLPLRHRPQTRLRWLVFIDVLKLKLTHECVVEDHVTLVLQLVYRMGNFNLLRYSRLVL